MKYSDSRSQLMKRNSRSLIRYCVGKLEKASRAQIEELTGLSHTRVCNVVDELIVENELMEIESVSIGPGRPITYLQINPNGTCAAGVWLAEETIEVGIAGATGEILVRDSLPYSGNPLDDIDAIVESIKTCATQAHKPLESMRGVGVVVSGLVDPSEGTITLTMYDTGFAGMPIASLLQERMGLPVYIDTDIRAAALADKWYKMEYERVLYISFSGGVGSAFIDGRELFGNAHGEAPLVGHIALDPNGPQCECGRCGCLQAYTSSNAFIRRLWPEVDLKQLSAQERRNMVEKGCDLASLGDAEATSAITTTARYMAQGVAHAVNMLDPQVVYVIGALVDYLPDMVMRIILEEVMPRISLRFLEVEIKPLSEISEFEIRGAIGLVLFQQFRTLTKDMNSRMLSPKTYNQI